MLREEFNVEGRVVAVKERLAEGGFGFIDLVADARTGREFCLKRCGIQNNESLDIVNKEIEMLQLLRCDNIVDLIGSEIKPAARNQKEAFILLEYCTNGHALDMLNKRNGKPLPMSEIWNIFSQVLKAVEVMHTHEPPITHRDLKLENILLTRGGGVKLCDFGSCVTGIVHLRNAIERSQAEEVISKTTTQAYRAPEMVDLYVRDHLTEKTDIWALGCILYTICFIRHPFQEAGNLGILNAKVTMPSDSPIVNSAKTLITRMLDIDPEARPTVKQLIEATRAASNGSSLPPYEISPIARQRKMEREEAQKRRQTLQQSRKKTNELPKRGPVKLDPNSAAARRLAAKRGVANPSASMVKNHPAKASPANRTEVDDSFGSRGESNLRSHEEIKPNFESRFSSDFLFSESPAGNDDRAFSSNTKRADDGFNNFDNFDAPSFSDSTPAVDDGFSNFNSTKEDFNNNGFATGFDCFEDGEVNLPKSSVPSSDLFFSSDPIKDQEHFDEQSSTHSSRSSKEHVDFFAHEESRTHTIDASGTSNEFDFFSGPEEQDQTLLNERDNFDMFETSAEFTHVNSSVSSTTKLFGEMSIENNEGERPATLDVFGNSDNPFDSVQETNKAASFDAFDTSSRQDAPRPQNDPFDMFSAPPTGTAQNSSTLFDSFAPGAGFPQSQSSVSAPSSTDSVMKMFNEGMKSDPFSDMQPSGSRSGMYNQSYHQSYSYYQSQQQQYGVRQTVPQNKNADPFHSLMGSMK